MSYINRSYRPRRVSRELRLRQRRMATYRPVSPVRWLAVTLNRPLEVD